MSLTQGDKVRLAMAVKAVIAVHGLKAAQDNGSKALLKSLLNPELQKESLKKCKPQNRELIEARFNALYENQEEALDIIQSILDPDYEKNKK